MAGLAGYFSGWMLAESPGLNAVEHPVYDVWLIGCRDPNRNSVDDDAAKGTAETDSKSDNSRGRTEGSQPSQ